MTAGCRPAFPVAAGDTWQCSTCGRWYVSTTAQLACAVMHPPGTCCHYGDQEVPAPASPEVSADDRGTAVQPTKGRIVLYKLSAPDALAIGRKRSFGNIDGNTVAAGDVFPGIVVQDWESGRVNLKVQLDGNDDYWATSRTEGSEPGQWAWPERAPAS